MVKTKTGMEEVGRLVGYNEPFRDMTEKVNNGYHRIVTLGSGNLRGRLFQEGGFNEARDNHFTYDSKSTRIANENMHLLRAYDHKMEDLKFNDNKLNFFYKVREN